LHLAASARGPLLFFARAYASILLVFAKVSTDATGWHFVVGLEISEAIFFGGTCAISATAYLICTYGLSIDID
jgi:hypothetical protein